VRNLRFLHSLSVRIMGGGPARPVGGGRRPAPVPADSLAPGGTSVPAGTPDAVASPVPELLRTFVALVPSEVTASALAAEGERIARADCAARPVPRENLHLTLLFLGPTPPQSVPRIAEALERAATGVGPVRIRPVGLSTFPGRRTRVVFASLAPDSHPVLEALAARVSGALSAFGSGSDPAGPFHPHITLARLESPSPSPALKKLLTEGALHDTYMDDVITDVRLLSSDATPVVPAPAEGNAAGTSRAPVRGAGRVYRALASIPLGSSPLGSSPFLGRS